MYLCSIFNICSMELRIKEVIKEKGYSVKSLAEKMDINRVNLSNMINGNPTVETLGKIADALEVPVTELFAKDRGVICPHCGGLVSVKLEAVSANIAPKDEQ